MEGSIETHVGYVGCQRAISKFRGFRGASYSDFIKDLGLQ